jgi:GTP-binding protein
MLIHKASFVRSSPTLKECPPPEKPEFAFIGRSNVGKSSLINMLTGFSKLAKISGQPGKTRTINHFIINEQWYLVDLPGYGYAKVPINLRDKWVKSTENYILKRDNLILLFVLLDIRIKPQSSDLKFMEFLGNKGIPFARVFTKCDKVSPTSAEKAMQIYDAEMHKNWESMPLTFLTSSVNGDGKEGILKCIEESINKFSNLP